ncbi:MAG: serine/threonine protein kinase [Myxococcales bacterium]|nr:serine/threonine protein kinase [Myxococcales bacterium]
MGTVGHTLVGRELNGRYRLERLLGQGGMGAVYEATQLALGKRVAIKLIKMGAEQEGVDEEATKQAISRFRREARIASEVGHPHIVDVYDLDEDDGLPYMAMERLRGRTLDALLNEQKKLEPMRAVFIAHQICSAIAAVHERGVIHRDLKPANVFLCDGAAFSDYVKVLDFGISKVLGASSVRTATGSLMGTPFYLAPEQAEMENARIGPWTDVFSLGSMLYRMLSGEVPFKGNNLALVVYAVVHREPIRLDVLCGIDEPLARVVARAMAKAPSSRFASARELALALLEVAPAVRERIRALAPGEQMGVEHVLAETSSPSAPVVAAPDERVAVPDESVPPTLITGPQAPPTIAQSVAPREQPASVSVAAVTRDQHVRALPTEPVVPAAAPARRAWLVAALLAGAGLVVLGVWIGRGRGGAGSGTANARVGSGVQRVGKASSADAASTRVAPTAKQAQRVDAAAAAQPVDAAAPISVASLARLFRRGRLDLVITRGHAMAGDESREKQARASAWTYVAAVHVQRGEATQANAAFRMALALAPKVKVPDAMPPHVHKALAKARIDNRKRPKAKRPVTKGKGKGKGKAKPELATNPHGKP